MVRNSFVIEKIKENKDGSAIIYLRYGKDFKEAIKDYGLLEKVAKKDIEQFVKEALVYSIVREVADNCICCDKLIPKGYEYCLQCVGVNRAIQETRKNKKRR